MTDTPLQESKDTDFCGFTVFCMPTVTVNVDDELKEKMDAHPEINWSEVTRQAIQTKLNQLELLDELVSGSDLSADDVDEIAAVIDERASDRLRESEAIVDDGDESGA